MESINLSFAEEALGAIATKAIERKTGARGLRSIVEVILLDTMFDLPSLEGGRGSGGLQAGRGGHRTSTLYLCRPHASDGRRHRLSCLILGQQSGVPPPAGDGVSASWNNNRRRLGSLLRDAYRRAPDRRAGALCARFRCLLEVNSQPDRLDLDDILVQMARDRGVRLAISTDAHATDSVAYMRFGVDQARRG
jgi:hypothetical protein